MQKKRTESVKKKIVHKNSHHPPPPQMINGRPLILVIPLRGVEYDIYCREPSAEGLQDCTMEMAKLNLSNTTYEYQLSRPR